MNSLMIYILSLLEFMLLLSMQLLLILAVRKPVARWFGAVNAYRLWLLPLLWLPFHWLALPSVDWQALAAMMGFGMVGAGPVGVVSWFQTGIADVSLDLAIPFFDFMSMDALSVMPLWKGGVLLWLVTALVLGCLQVWITLRFTWELCLLQRTPSAALQESLHREVGMEKLPRVASVDGIGTPALFGVLRPVLLLPADFHTRFDAEQRRLILAHELVHYQRCDNIWNLLATALRVLFWFNPFMHFAWRAYRLDQELSCDAVALGKADGKAVVLYVKTLVDAVSGRYGYPRYQPALTAWGDSRELKERTRMIQRHSTKSPLHKSGLSFLILLLVLGVQATSWLSSGFVPRVLAQADTVEPTQDVLRREFYDVIEKVMALRDGLQDPVGAMELLAPVHARQEAGELNPRETFVLWQFQANLSMALEEYRDALDYTRRILAMPEIASQERMQALQQAGGLAYLLREYEVSVGYHQEQLELLGRLQASEALDAVKATINMKIAYAWYQLGDFANALSYAESAMELNPRDRGSYTFLRALYLQTANTEAGVRIENLMREHFGEVETATPSELLSQAGQQTGADPISPARMEYLPIVVTQPRYPRQALDQRLTGWVQVQFDVNEEGAVINPVVKDSEPEGVFDQASLDAISRFKFTPRTESDVAVVTQGVQYVFRFNLQQ